SKKFQRSETKTLFYETYLKKDSEKNSPEGKSVEIDFNYLKLNPIKSIKGQNEEKEAIIRDKVLNIIVPNSKMGLVKDI
ncbi:bacteriocin immunity protein, partial [Listeria monocytogenes]